VTFFLDKRMAPSIRASDLSATLRHTLKQPVAVSALASLGVHIILFATMPLWSRAAFSDTEPDIPRSVDLIELTPEEQSRLPEMSTPITLPPLFQDSPDMTLLPVPDQTTPPPPPSGFFAEPLFPSFPSFGGTIPTPRTNPVPVPPPPAVRPSPQAEEPETAESDSDTGSIDTASGLPAFTGRRRGQILEELELDDFSDESSNEPATTAQADPAPTQPAARSNEEIIAGLQQDIRARQQRMQEQQLLTYNTQGTSQDPNYSEGGSWLAWMESLAQNYGVDLSSVNPESNQFEKTSIQDLFPPEACGHIGETLSADYGVVVDSNGEPIADSLAVLRNSGYGLLDARGAEAVLNSTFENGTGANMPYQITVEFPYTGNSCANQNRVSQAVE
jgi:hypothetical protein